MTRKGLVVGSCGHVQFLVAPVIAMGLCAKLNNIKTYLKRKAKKIIKDNTTINNYFYYFD